MGKYAAFAYAILLAVAVEPALAGPPFMTDDPTPVEKGHWEFYLFSALDKNNYSSEAPNLAAPGAEFNMGVLPDLELGVQTMYSWALPPAVPAANGLGDSQIAGKYRFLHESPYIPAMSIAPSIVIPTGNADRNLGNGKAWYRIPLWLQKTWDSWETYGGGGYAINPQKGNKNFVFGGWTLQKTLSEQLAIGAEIFSQGACCTDTRSFTVLNVGGTYNFTPQFSVLFSAGHSILGEIHTMGYLSLYWTEP